MMPLRAAVLGGALLLAPVLAQAQDKQESDIVVTGTPLDETDKALRDCLARHCPPAEDIKATLRHSENQFLHGDYRGSLGTLRQSGGRNREYRKQVGPEFADLMRATALVSRHLGEDQLYRVSTLSAQEVLADTLPPNDPARLTSQLEIGDMYGHVGRVAEAESNYRDVLGKAKAAGLADIAASARLRIVNLYILLAQSPAAASTYQRKAHAILADMAADPDPRAQRFLLAGKLMVARIAADRGDEKEQNEALAYYKAHATTLNPVLISSKAADLREGRLSDTTSFSKSVNGADSRATQQLDGQWFDVSFWVKPDGRVESVDVLRKSKQLAGPWAKAVLDTIASRRYAPLPLPPLDPGVLRIERYTYTSPYRRITETRIMQHSPHGRIEMIDLSNDAGDRPRPGG
ncbi:hypothetical protein ACCC88_18830 [Sphingomonas sp. Sphisp140]|uniref:hypothetical protein n=1 Tax=unclassified Sphingomonas TaxID=196159 RepID=UPI0039B12925